MAQSTDPMSIYSDGQRRTAPPPGLQSDDNKDGHENVSMFRKVKNKGKKLRDKVQENYKARYGHSSDDKEEEETVEDEDLEKPSRIEDENVDDVTNKDDRADQGSEKVNKTTLGDILGKKNDGMSAEETMKESEGPDDEVRHKDGILTDSKENPQEVLSSFEESGQDENVDDVKKGMAGLGGLGTANKADKADQGSEKVNKTTLGDILGKKNDGLSAEETMKESEGPDDEVRHKDSIFTDSKENPQEGLSSFEESGQDENVDDVTKGVAGLSGLGAADEDDRASQESGNVIKSSLGDIIGKNDDGMSVEETRKESEGPDDDVRKKDSIWTDSKENPQEILSSFEENGQVRGNSCDDILTTRKDEFGTDVGTPYIPQRAAQGMPGATGGIIGLGKGNKQEEGGEEKPNSSKFDEPPFGLKEVPKPLEEEFQSLLEKSNKDPQNDAGEGNELSSNEKHTEEVISSAPVDTKKASGLIQGLKDSLTSDQGEKDDIVAEEQSRENQDKEMQSEGEEKRGQSYVEKLYDVKNVIASKMGYGALPIEQKAPLEESRGEDKPQGLKAEENLIEEAESGASVDT